MAAIYWGAIVGMGRKGLRRPLSRGELAQELAHTLVPIAAAYVVAHYFSLLAYNGQDLWRLASDPLGDGSDLFGGAGAAIDYSVVSATAIWYVQVGALVIGHVAAPCSATTARWRSTGPPRRDPLADRHAGPDGVLHVPRPLSALGVELVIVLAHAGHWLVKLADAGRC